MGALMYPVPRYQYSRPKHCPFLPGTAAVHPAQAVACGCVRTWRQSQAGRRAADLEPDTPGDVCRPSSSSPEHAAKARGLCPDGAGFLSVLGGVKMTGESMLVCMARPLY